MRSYVAMATIFITTAIYDIGGRHVPWVTLVAEFVMLAGSLYLDFRDRISNTNR